MSTVEKLDAEWERLQVWKRRTLAYHDDCPDPRRRAQAKRLLDELNDRLARLTEEIDRYERRRR